MSGKHHSTFCALKTGSREDGGLIVFWEITMAAGMKLYSYIFDCMHENSSEDCQSRCSLVAAVN